MANNVSHVEGPESIEELLAELQEIGGSASVFRTGTHGPGASPMFVVIPGDPDAGLASAMSRAARLVAESWSSSSHSEALPLPEQGIWESVGARLHRGEGGAATAATAVLVEHLESDCLVGNDAVAALLGVDRSRISQMVSDRQLYAFEGSTGQRLFPSWQFPRGRPVGRLKVILDHLDPGLHPLTISHWMTTPHVDLQVDGQVLSPVEWLVSSGATAAVARLARDL